MNQIKIIIGLFVFIILGFLTFIGISNLNSSSAEAGSEDILCWSGNYQYLLKDRSQAKKFCKCAQGTYGYGSYSFNPGAQMVYKYQDAQDNGNWEVVQVSAKQSVYQVKCTDENWYSTNQDYYTAKPATVVVNLSPTFEPNERWMDIADNVYSGEFRSTYQYANAQVTASYEVPVNQIKFEIQATGLKPNFAYQVKLEGLPSEDPWANQILGNLGRWWNDVGYLIFSYVVADDYGRVNFTANVDSSYHVLWKTDQRRRTRNDGPIIKHYVAGHTDYGYDIAVDGPRVDVYGEWETGRPKPGTLVLPSGNYHILLRISEESFHSQDALGGNWASVLDAPVDFTVK